MTQRKKKSPVRLARKTSEAKPTAETNMEKPKAEEKEKTEPKAEEKEKTEAKVDEPRLGVYEDMPGYIEDPVNVFKLVMLESKMKQNLYEKEVVMMRLDNQIRALQAKRNELLLHHDRLHRNFDQAIVNQGRYIEEKHKIGLRYYTYNDETGVLTKQEQKEEKKKE